MNDSKLKPYVLYIIISLFFLSLIRGTFKMDRNERNIRLQEELCKVDEVYCCLLYTSPSPRDAQLSRMPSSA